MYQGNGHIWHNRFNKISDFMERWYVDPKDKGPRPSAEYRGALRNAARNAYRIAKRTMRDLERQKQVLEADQAKTQADVQASEDSAKIS